MKDSLSWGSGERIVTGTITIHVKWKEWGSDQKGVKQHSKTVQKQERFINCKNHEEENDAVYHFGAYPQSTSCALVL